MSQIRTLLVGDCQRRLLLSAAVALTAALLAGPAQAQTGRIYPPGGVRGFQRALIQKQMVRNPGTPVVAAPPRVPQYYNWYQVVPAPAAAPVAAAGPNMVTLVGPEGEERQFELQGPIVVNVLPTNLTYSWYTAPAPYQVPVANYYEAPRR